MGPWTHLEDGIANTIPRPSFNHHHTPPRPHHYECHASIKDGKMHKLINTSNISQKLALQDSDKCVMERAWILEGPEP